MQETKRAQHPLRFIVLNIIFGGFIGVAFMVDRTVGDFSFLIATACFAAIVIMGICRSQRLSKSIILGFVLALGLVALAVFTLLWRDYLKLTESFGTSALHASTFLWTAFLLGVSVVIISSFKLYLRLKRNAE